MNINFKQSQFELFPGTSASSADAIKPRCLFANLTLSLENIVVIGILLMMALVFSFSLGMEKGKRFTENKVGNVPVKVTIPAKDVVSSNPVQNKTMPAAHGNVKPGTLQDPVQTTIVPNYGPAIEPLKAKTPLEELKNNTYTIQVASFKKVDYANKEAQDLKKKGHEIMVLGKGEHFIVCVGKFISENEAKTFSGRLKKQYKDCLVRRL